MRKAILSDPPTSAAPVTRHWLNLEACAQVEVTSEDPARPIESALAHASSPTGWRAATSGEQRIRLLFDEPQSLRHIRLLFREPDQARTQEFVLRWRSASDDAWREIVRQQYNFSPFGATEEAEGYDVELENVAGLELAIIPNVAGGDTVASLSELRLAA